MIRSLGRAGKEVHVAWCARDSVSKASKYVHRVHTPTRPPARDWQNEFRELLEREQFDLIIPCNDPSILPLHQQREFFAAYRIYLVDAAIFDTVMDKASVNKIAAGAGLKLPNEVTIRAAEELAQIDALSPPYVLKPTQSYVASSLSQKNHVVIESDRDAACRKIEKMLASTPVAVQEFFDGRGVGVEFIAKEGKVLTAFQHARLHEPPRGGGSSYRNSCRLDPELKAATESLVGAMGYTGIGMAEFRYNSKKRDWIFVELNSRFWGSLPLAVNCGADFPAYLFDLYCENRTDFPQDYRVGRACRNWFLDLRWFRETLSENRFSVAKHLSLAGQLLWELRYPVTFRETSDTIAWDDPAPGIREIKEAATAIPRRIRRKAARWSSKIAPLRNRARQRMLSRLSRAKHILFVCKGNICRSPFAEQYARSTIGHLETVSSSGYFPKQDRPSPDNAQVAASEFDVDLSSHRSSMLSPEAVEKADAILIFDEENRDEIWSSFPRARSKTYLLGMLMEGSEFEIHDPYGGTVDDFRSIYAKITRAIDCLSH